MQPHLDLACAKLNNTQEELKISQDTTSNLALRVTELENQLELFQTQFGNVEGKVDDVKDRVETLEMTLKDVVESKTKLDMEEFPPYLWTVTDFWEKVSRAKICREVLIESDSFYLGQPGYKMKLRMFPNGVKGGVKGYISLFFVLMKGQHDAILPWPFRYKGTFTVIDQNPDLKQRQNYSRSFFSGPNSIRRRGRPSFIARPTFTLPPTSEENKGWGLDLFLSHGELRKNSYVVDETLLIKFEASRCENV